MAQRGAMTVWLGVDPTYVFFDFLGKKFAIQKKWPFWEKTCEYTYSTTMELHVLERNGALSAKRTPLKKNDMEIYELVKYT